MKKDLHMTAKKHTHKRSTAERMQSLTSVISTTMVLILLGLVVLFALTARVMGNSVRENLTVTVVMNDGVPTAEAMALQGQLLEKPYAAHIQYISSEQALSEHIESMGTDPTDIVGANPFAISLEMQIAARYACNDSLSWIAKEIKEMDNVSDVMYEKDLVESLNTNLQRVSIILLVIAALLVLVSLVLINNTVRLSVHSHRFTIQTMKLVGARWGFIRRPFMLRSLWIGIVSALLADAVLLGCIRWASSFDHAVVEYVTWPNIGIMSLSVLIFGLLITLVCTYLSVTNYLRKRENELY